MNSGNLLERARFPLSLIPPLVALIVQSALWSSFRPLAWFLFYPAVFFSSWIGGVRSGLAATMGSTLIVWWFFIPTEHSLNLEHPSSLLSIGMFVCMGVLFSLFHGKKAEEMLSIQTGYFQQLFEGLPEGVVLVDNEDRVIKANKAFERLFQYVPDEIKGESVNDLIVPVEGRAEAVALTRESSQGHVVRRDTVRKRKDGSLIEVMVIGFPITIEGRLVGVFGLYLDISERKKLEAQFLRTQRLESIGTLAGGIAHDLNNVLGPIMLSLDILRKRVTDPTLLKILDTVAMSSRRGADLIRQVLSFARGVEGQHVVIEMKHVVKEVEAIIQETFPKSISIVSVVPKDLWTIRGDSTQIHQVLMNLSVNARDAMPQGGAIEIKTENVVLDRQYLGTNLEIRTGNFVVISVKDTGIGMSNETKDRIFEPFFSTKEVGKGTGLGLSTVHAVVKSHGGFVTVYSEVGEGTIFRVYLPAQAASNMPEGPGKADIPRGKGEKILVVDDEEAVREITRAALEAYGYSVIVAADGAEAVGRYAEYRKEIALVVTDMMMPYMDGPTTIQALRRLDPALRILAVSGLEHETRKDLKVETLMKPYTSEKLLTAIRNMLDR